MAVMWVYVTTGGRAEAERIGRQAVASRLAACANVIGGAIAIYWWEGKIERGREAVLILKTTKARLKPLIAKIRRLHSYDCPCIEAIRVAAGYKPYLDWVAREARPRRTLKARR
ncbi:MAG TPA: divalent-cation tolerance protein CutA [Stellaceae bacterium]|nr:divalent-cation tolerance protein CutA [Stellaceae bacterium]